MKLDNIGLEGRDAQDDKGLIAAIEKLPEDTVQGISGFGDVVARYEAWAGEGTVVGIVSRGHDGDILTLNIPEKSSGSMKFSSGSFCFDYENNTYAVHNVGTCQISKE